MLDDLALSTTQAGNPMVEQAAQEILRRIGSHAGPRRQAREDIHLHKALKSATYPYRQ